MAKDISFYLIYSFNFARKSGSSTLRSSLPEAATSRTAALNMAPLPAQAACCLTYPAAAAQAITALALLPATGLRYLNQSADARGNFLYVIYNYHELMQDDWFYALSISPICGSHAFVFKRFATKEY